MSDLSAVQLADLVAKAKLTMRLGDDDQDLRADAFAIYHDQGDSASAATVQMESGTLTLVVTDGTDAGTYTYDTSGTAYDTLSELVDAINTADKGFVATLLGDGDADSALLYRLASTSCYGQSNEQTLEMENQELLELAIGHVWAALETTIGYGLLSTSYTELAPLPSGACNLILRHPQVSAVTMVALETEAGLRAKYTGTGTHARIDVTATAVVCTSRAGGTTTTNTLAFADYATTTLMAEAINALSGWTSTVVNSRPSAYLVRIGSQSAKDRELTLEVWSDYTGDYSVDYEAGVIDFDGPIISDVRGWSLVAYTAGLSAIPTDIESMVLRVLKAAWDESKRDGGLAEERLGDYAYKIGQRADFTPHETVIGHYRRYLA